MPPYSRVANRFIDPVGGGLGTYSWLVNHTELDGPKRSSNLEFDGRSDGNGVVATQGDFQPLLIDLSGTILHKSQLIEFWKWRQLDNSFEFIDFEGNDYEVAMISFEPKNVRVALNHSDLVNMPSYKVEYNMQLWIIRLIAGDLFDAGVPE